MPKVALADSLTDWETLIANASIHEGDDALLAQNLNALREVLEHAKQTQAWRLHLDAERQLATQALTEDKAKGKKLAERVRHTLRAIYGANGPCLPAFGMKPRPLAKGASPVTPLYRAPELAELDAAPESEQAADPLSSRGRHPRKAPSTL